MEVLFGVLIVLLGSSIIFNIVQSKTFASKPKHYPGLPQRSAGFFPYLCSDKQYITWIMLYNRSDYITDVEFEFRDQAGTVTKKLTKKLNPHQCLRYSEGNFTGSVEFVGWGDGDALYAIIEMREKSGKGAALAAHAVNAYGMPWFFYLGVEDEGPNKKRTTLISRNLDIKPLYIEYGFGFAKCPKGDKDTWGTAHFYEVKVPAGGHVGFSPYDKTKQPVNNDVNASGNTGPKNSGSQSRFHTGTHLVETPHDIALHNYKPLMAPVTSGWPKTPELYWAYFAGVQDDGITRADRIYIKSTLNQVKQAHNFSVHFYGLNGHKITAPPGKKLCLALDFDHPTSSATLSPREFLGQDFNGSVVIELPLEHTGHTEAIIRRQAPGSWQDLSDASPGQAYLNHVIPYVSNKDQDWTYQLILFYPAILMKRSQPAPKDALPPFNGPKIKIPTLGGGWVALKLHKMSGKYIGWIALKMKPNETQYYTVNQLIGKYLKEPFEGSIEVEPRHVVSQLHVFGSKGTQHGFTGTWTA